MKSLSVITRKRGRLAAGIALGGVVFVSLTGAYALRSFFARPGEGALQYVPADSLLVASIDLVPSPTQALAFKRIDDSLDRNTFDHLFEKSILELIDHSKSAEALRPLILRSGAVCMTNNAENPNSQDGILFLAVKDGKEALQILQKNAYPKFYKGLKYFKTGKGSMLVMVMDDFLVLSDKPQQFARVLAVKNGEAKAITSVPEFEEGRHAIAEDSNLVLYVSPKIVASVAKGSEDKMSLPEWATIGLSIRDGGLGMSMATKMDPSKNAGFQAMSQIAPVRTDLFQVLPSGSYGMMVLSNPSEYFNAMKSGWKDGKELDKTIAQMEDSVQKGIGLSIQKDLIPALKGDAVAAVYPSQDGAPAGVDLLMIVDDSNGANPADAVDRFQSFVEAQVAKEGNSPKLFVEQKMVGGREFKVNDKVETDMRKSIGNGMSPDSVRKDILVGKKTVVFAMVGKAVIASTSQDLLDKAVASYTSKTNGLNGDPKLGASEKTMLDGSQSFAVFSLSRIAEGIKNTMVTSKMSADDKKLFDGVISAFESLNDPLYLKGKASPDGLSTGGVFIPLDYDKLIDIIGGAVNKKH